MVKHGGWSRPAFVIGVICTATLVGLLAGRVHGERYVQPRSIGESVGLALVAYLVYAAIPLVAGLVLGSTTRRWGPVALATSIGLVVAAILVGFSSRVAIGGEQGFAEEYVNGAVSVLVVVVGLGAVAGYGVGRLVRRIRARVAEDWECPVCHLLDRPSDARCRYCGAERPSEAM